MIERDQKKFNQAKRKLSAEVNAGARHNPTREEIEKLAEHLKNSSKSYQTVTKQFNPTATSAPTKVVMPMAPLKTSPLPGTFQFKNTTLPAKLNNDTTFAPQLLEQSINMLDAPELQLDDDIVDVDLAYNEQLFSFNILSIDPKLNPLTLTVEQQSLLQLSFLAKYHHDQASNFKIASHDLSPFQPHLCLSCRSNLQHRQLGKQICEECENKQSTLKEFNHYLTILKLNTTQDLYRVIFMTNISLDELLKSSLSDNKSPQNILKLLYVKYVVPINQVTNAEFVIPNNEDDEDNTKDNQVLKRVLKCASDHSALSFTDAAIDPEALSLSTPDNNNHGATVECKFSQLVMNYDMNTGDFVMSFSHSYH